ncbi:hypothetical protein [Flavobacterium sp. 9AF]|uniref:hypothetical protein n=1 Tax=Flavobacterium sp. 9AF TaxID=2653142 RepID=UPI001356E2ED|nr:hypothetical protein [Flavobacterium sp. 9AF]
MKIIAKKGHYKNRIQIAESLKLLNDEEKAELISIQIDDSIEVVFEKAIEVAHTSKVSRQLKQKMEERKTIWAAKKINEELQKEITSKKLKDTTNYKRKFGSGESLDTVKKMLKKPINTGKWF